MPASTVFFIITGMSIGVWMVIFFLAMSDKRSHDFYAFMTGLVGIVYTFGSVFISLASISFVEVS